jgi:ferrous-iron efflux pump FieF
MSARAPLPGPEPTRPALSGPALSAADDRRLRLRAATASLAVALVLVTVKVAAALATSSVALLASLVDSLSDVAASGLTFLAVRHAARPPDADHRFGHGKAEALSSLSQAALIAGSAFFVVHEAWSTLRAGGQVERTPLGLAAMAVALLLTGALVLYQRHVVRATSSLAIAGDSAHYRTDLYAALAVIGALAASEWTGARWIDPTVGVGIALYLLLTAWEVGRRAVDELMDRELPETDRRRIEELVRSAPQVLGLHDLRTRTSGASTFVELHLELDPDLRLRQAHRVAEEVARRLHAAFPRCELLVHQDPAGLDEVRLDDRVAAAEAAPAAPSTAPSTAPSAAPGTAPSAAPGPPQAP